MSIRKSGNAAPATLTNTTNTTNATFSSQHVLATIEQAKVANAAWMASVAKPSGDSLADSTSVTDIGVAPTSTEITKEKKVPWELKFTQSVEDIGGGERMVVHEIKLMGGTYSRLRGMTNAISDSLQAAYQGNGWTIDQPGKVFKVCANPDMSSSTWKFSKPLIGAPTVPWVLPVYGDEPIPFFSLASITNAPMQAGRFFMTVLNDATYRVTEHGTDTPGQLATIKFVYESS